MSYSRTWVSYFFLLGLVFSLASCAPNDPEVLEERDNTAVPTGVEVVELPVGVEVISVTEETTNIGEIVQKKSFDQCESVSPFKAVIGFSSSSGEQVQEGLVLAGGAEGEVGLSVAAKVKVSGAIEDHYFRNIIEHDEHGESVQIEVPPLTKQEYTITWQENRREGRVEYVEDGITKVSKYSYRLGVEFSHSVVVDLDCPEQIASAQKATATTPSHQEAITKPPTPVEVQATATPTLSPPTETPAPTSTPQNTGLAVGQWYTSGNVSIGLTEVKFRTQTSNYIDLEVSVRNVSNSPISFEYGVYNFMVRDNLGNTYPAEEGYTPAQGSGPRTVTLNAGQTESDLNPGSCCGIFFPVNHSDSNITELVFSISDLSSVDYAEWTIQINH